MFFRESLTNKTNFIVQNNLLIKHKKNLESAGKFEKLIGLYLFCI